MLRPHWSITKCSCIHQLYKSVTFCIQGDSQTFQSAEKFKKKNEKEKKKKKKKRDGISGKKNTKEPP